MAEENRKFQLSRDVLGGILFTLSSFPLVLVVMGILRDPGAGGAAAAAQALVAWLGHAAPILWSGGFALVGTIMVLGNDKFPVGKTLLGISGTALGLAVLLGAILPDGGGSFGGATGGAVARRLAEPVAIFFGVVCVLAPIWFAWLRGLVAENSVAGQPDVDALSDTEGGSVSSEEAALLVPDESSAEYLEEVWREVHNAERPPIVAPSPYPDDPRLAGALPDGTAPIETKNVQARSDSKTGAPASKWKRPRGEVDTTVGAGADLAAGQAESSAEDVEPVEKPAAAARSTELSDPVEVIDRRLEALEPVPTVEPFPEIEPFATREASEPVALQADAMPAAAPEAVEPRDGAKPIAVRQAGPPTPSWEQSDLFQQPDGDAGSAAEVEELARNTADSELTGAAEAHATIVEAVDEEELEEEDEEELEEEDEEELEEEDEEELEEEDEEELEEEDEEELEEEDEEELEEEDEEELEEEDEEELEEEPIAAEIEEEEVQDEITAVEPEAEPEVVIQPPSVPVADKIPSQPAVASDTSAAGVDSQLLFEAGAHFLEEGRVAVSMLQRKFGLDFDQACELLDELQERGLIGPYLGGQRRDILLSLEQWEVTVTNA
ncbi:MAG: hypothetical protein ACI80N_000546 [Gammaproteobacteria bacterium]|jgi:hypothetical protein